MQFFTLRQLACTFAAVVLWQLPALGAPTDAACKARVNDTTDKVVECIRREGLWSHMVALQAIADRNPGPDGHPSRNSGEPGYRASLDYVASLMRAAGYRVEVQPYTIPYFAISGTPQFTEVSPVERSFEVSRDWYVAYYSGGGSIAATVQPVGGIVIPASGFSTSGCKPADFSGFSAGNIALVQRGGCGIDLKIANAVAAGATAVIIFNEGNGAERMAPPGFFLSRLSAIPVLATSYAVGAELYAQSAAGTAPYVQLNVETIVDPAREDYNLIADSPFGDPNHVVVVEGHLDAIFGAGMLDNASGSATILETALTLANTPTRNQLRYIWFGGEEIGLLGSAYYTRSLSTAERNRIAFDIDADVTGTPNHDYVIANPAYASNVGAFPRNVVPESALGNRYFADFFASMNLFALDGPTSGGNNGTDSNSLSLIGIPNAGIFTGQDCCKTVDAVGIWGGYVGNREGTVPGFDGGCVDYIGRWCDNLDNVDPNTFELASRSVAYVAFRMANQAFPNSERTSVVPRGPAAPVLPGRRGLTSE